MLTIAEGYAPRPIRSLDLWQVEGWRLKPYTIAYRRPAPRAELLDAAHALVRTHLPIFGAGKNHYGVGFVGVHDGKDAAFIFVDFWADVNELHHHVYVAPIDGPQDLEYRTPTGLSACVWDLQVICHERQAWIDTVLANPAGPDLDAYLARRLDDDA